MRCFFVSDLHGRPARYRALWERVRLERPDVVLVGGDLLPSPFDRRWAGAGAGEDFVADYLAPELARLAADLGPAYPRFLVILGNDDARAREPDVVRLADEGLWHYVHARRLDLDGLAVYGYSYVPPSPFQLKDWERYDVSRFVDPGCVSPEEGVRTVAVPANEARLATIARDLDDLAGDDDLSRALLLCHTPPYHTALDRAALDGRLVDHCPVDVHVGSIALRRFIEHRQPLASLHGHIHESARLTGTWHDRIGRTHLLGAAHDGPELALVRFDPDDLAGATRELV